MKSYILPIALFTSTIFAANAQQAHCGFDEHLERMLTADPSGLQTIVELEEAATELTRQRLAGEADRAGGPRIIPTVFHVIHQGGSENISNEQIEDAVRILNEDFRRQNADTVNTRPVFQPVAADANVEFRLAKLDPQGNCTDGIVRVWSPLTYNASDDNGVKGLSYWDRNKYFNVWVVSSIDNDGEAGTILGYAQFPGFGSAQTDGVVVRADRTGSIGTAAPTGDKGRTLTHEAGHWLGLFHTFQGGCTGGFFGEGVDDTPPQAEATPSNCPQNSNTCSNDNPDLPDMVENYMDYSNGSCQNTYTLGQKDRMDAVLNGNRTQIHSASNLNTTGVLLGETPCAPKADFFATTTVVCAGQDITLTDASYNGQVTTYDWQLPGATPSSSGSANPTVSYDTPGIYSVTLNVSNAQGSDSETRTDYIQVIPNTAAIQTYFSHEGFEGSQQDYIVLSDGLGSTWQETSAAAYSGSKAIHLNNYNANPLGSQDEFMLPSVDLTLMNNPQLFFRLAYKQRSGGESDNLRVYVSKDCGDTWALRFNKSGVSLATVSGTQGSTFTPGSQADWELVNVNLSSFSSEEHLLVKFRGTSAGGNNIYLDDIQISGPLGVEDEMAGATFTVGPNPMADVALIGLESVGAEHYRISVTDVAGRQVAQLHSGPLSAGNHQFTLNRHMFHAAGVFFIHLESEQGSMVRKLVVQ